MGKIQVYQYNPTTNQLIDSYSSIAEAARVMKVNESSIREAIKNRTKSCGYNWTNQQLDNQQVSNNNQQSKSPLQELLEETQIPVEDVNHYWYKGKHFSVHVKNTKLSPEVQFKYLLDEIRQEVKPIEPKKRSSISLNCAVINIYDAHLDKRDIRYREGNNQVDRLTIELEQGFSELLKATLVHEPSTFVLPIGNDLFTTNGFYSTTKKGTPQDPVVPYDVVFQKGLKFIRKIIDTLVEYGDVYVPMIYGNHSVDREWFLGMCLALIYEKNPNVHIENTLQDRKYFQYQDNLFGFTHGDKLKNNIDKLPLVMATENPKIWGETKYRCFYCGDQHHKQEYKFLRTKDYTGCEVRYLRSVSITDAWHNENGFIGIPRTMESHIWTSTKGQIANYSVNI